MRNIGRLVAGLVLGAVALAAGGCDSDGSSASREVWGQDYGAYALSVGEASDTGQVEATPKALALPARVAVAEVGSVSPPTALLTRMRRQPAVFADALQISHRVRRQAVAGSVLEMTMRGM